MKLVQEIYRSGGGGGGGDNDDDYDIDVCYESGYNCPFCDDDDD